MVNAITASSVDIGGFQIISLALFMGPLPNCCSRKKASAFTPGNLMLFG
jgi:hypothetical protein